MAEINSVSQQLFSLSGELRFDNVVALKQQGEQLLANAGQDCEVDLAGVTRAGSAAVSLLLSWLRYASAANISLVFSHLPADLLGVAQVSGIDKILPVKA